MAQAKHNDTSVEINRRSVLTAALAAPLAAVPAVAVAETETPVMALFREWKAAKAAEMALEMKHREAASDEIEAQADAAADRRYAIELEMVRTPSQNATDVLTKISVWTDFGVFQFDESDERLSPTWAEARALVGEV